MSSSADDRIWDALVVGAGPAGSMTARALALQGASVLLVERQPFPRWKVCGACLSPGTQSLLDEAGLGDLASNLGAVPLSTLDLRGWSTSAAVPLAGSVALSRSALDEALVSEAVAAGATLLAPARARPVGGELGGGAESQIGSRAVRIEQHGDSTVVRARVVVAADGLGSPFLSGAGHPDEAPPRLSHAPKIGLGAVFPAETPGFEAGTIHMAVGAAGYVGLVRLEDGALDVACALERRRLGPGIRPEDLVAGLMADAGMPALSGTPVSGWKGTQELTRTPPVLGGERLFAVGDAAGYVEPFTGEGIAWALAGARALAPIAAQGIRDWRPHLVDDWAREHARTVGRAASLCRALAWGLRRPAVSHTVLRALRLAPSAAGPFVRRAARAPMGLGTTS
ncbi:MAG: NAD(P)/FAD-dependent oxidoreductase [Planctomycetota bacterium]